MTFPGHVEGFVKATIERNVAWSTKNIPVATLARSWIAETQEGSLRITKQVWLPSDYAGRSLAPDARPPFLTRSASSWPSVG